MKAANWAAILFFSMYFSVSMNAQQADFLDFKPKIQVMDTLSPMAWKQSFRTFSRAQLPFFCKLEYDWAKVAGLQVKFRLGDIDYVNKLEGKLP